MRPHVVKRHISLGVDQIGRVGKAAVSLVRRTFKIIDEHRPWDAFLLLVAQGVMPFLLKALIGGNVWTGVRLPDEHIYEVHPRDPTRMKLFQRLDRADSDRSCEGAE